jgi:hypothetical protein
MSISILLFAALLSHGAFGGSASPPYAPAAAPPFTLSISASPKVARVGVSVVVKVTLTNTSTHAVHLAYMFALRGEMYRIDVRDAENHRPRPAKPQTWIGANGRRVTRTNVGGSVGVLDLRPGQTLTDDYPLNDHYDLAQPGRYTIQVSRFDEETKTWVKSNTITLTVTP